MNSKKNTFCNNCGKLGHLFHQCKIPITSIGVIAIRKNNNNIEILLIREIKEKYYQKIYLNTLRNGRFLRT